MMQTHHDLTHWFLFNQITSYKQQFFPSDSNGFCHKNTSPQLIHSFYYSTKCVLARYKKWFFNNNKHYETTEVVKKRIDLFIYPRCIDTYAIWYIQSYVWHITCLVRHTHTLITHDLCVKVTDFKWNGEIWAYCCLRNVWQFNAVSTVNAFNHNLCENWANLQ